MLALATFLNHKDFLGKLIRKNKIFVYKVFFVIYLNEIFIQNLLKPNCKISRRLHVVCVSKKSDKVSYKFTILLCVIDKIKSGFKLIFTFFGYIQEKIQNRCLPKVAVIAIQSGLSFIYFTSFYLLCLDFNNLP